MEESSTKPRMGGTPMACSHQMSRRPPAYEEGFNENEHGCSSWKPALRVEVDRAIQVGAWEGHLSASDGRAGSTRDPHSKWARAVALPILLQRLAPQNDLLSARKSGRQCPSPATD